MDSKLTPAKRFALIVEASGRIIDLENIDENPFRFELLKGTKVDEVLPFLFGIFPITDNEILIDSIRYKDFFGNILIKVSSADVKIEFYNNPNGLVQWEQIVQKHNQEHLINSIVNKTDSSALSCNVLYTLGFMTFKQCEKGFELIGNIPNWFRKLFPNYNYSSVVFQLEELFPFFEVFMSEVSDLFNSQHDGKIVSGLWTEFTHNNEEVILQASAVRENGFNFVFLEPISDRNPDKQKNLQKLREQSLAYRQLAKTEDKLRNVLKYREQFISIFSHDIKGPLGGIYSLIELLKEDEEFMGNFKPSHQHLFNVIYKDVRSLHDYATKLYDWSNINFGHMELDLEVVDFNITIQDLLTNLEDKTFTKKLEVITNIPSQFMINVDEVFFKNVLYNLMNNAIKFSYPLGKITITALENEDSKSIIIEDRGVGMSKDTKEAIFNFDMKKTSSGTSGEKGSGIGLTIVKKILDMHNIDIKVKSELEKGTSIELMLKK